MSRYAWFVAAVFLCIISEIPAQNDSPKDFKFSTVDLKLLDEVQELDRQFEKKGMIYRDPRLTSYLEEVASRLMPDIPQPERVEFKCRVLRDPMVNAFALPNGSIYVNSGLLAVLENEAQLAGVLAHEITHVIHRHTYRENRSLRKKSVALHVFSAIGAAGGYFPAGSVFGATLTLAGTISQILLMTSVFGYSQDLERDADNNAVVLMTAGSYDAAAMPRTFQLLDENLEIEPIETFYRTHPKLKERISTSTELAKKQALKESRKVSEAEYLARVADAVSYNVGADIASRRARTAVARANRLVGWKPDELAYQVLLADAYCALGAKGATPSEQELTKHGQADHRKRYLKLTEQEEERELLATPAGPAQKKANQEKSEKLYIDAIAHNSSLADAYRGLGMLYEEQSRSSEAIRAYRQYLDLAPPEAIDRLRIESRVKRLEKPHALAHKEGGS
jgi:predicted Zn-dependent protease